jgi:hypothetical protein
MADLLLVVNARGSLRLTLLRLLYGALFRTELFVLNFKARSFDVVCVVLLEFAGFY